VDKRAWRVTEEASHAGMSDISGLSDIDAAATLRHVSMHIAIDHGGFCRFSRPAVLSLVVAPIQINYPCFLATLGAKREVSGYFITDARISPPSAAGHFSEALTLLPHYHFTEHADFFSVPIVVGEGGLGIRAHLIFAMLNTIYKLDPVMMDVLVNVMRSSGDAKSLLWLKHKEEDPISERSKVSLLAEAASRGLTSTRIRWKLNADSKQAHLHETAQADLFLDTIRVNAVWTAFDMLWAGLPILSVSGEKMGSRISASLLASVGFGDELNTHSLKEYEDAAMGLATAAYTLSLQ